MVTLEAERVYDMELAITDMHTPPKKINDYAAQIVEMGLSPFKGF
ncbi:MAG: hypothetical protein WBX11_11885 [Thiobacillaceae bacterium]